MHTKRRRVKISQFLPRISYIEIQGRRANDIKHSASWEATQVFLNLPFQEYPNVATFGATSRSSGPRRDVPETCTNPRRDVNLYQPLSRRDVNFTRRDVDWYRSLSRRDVAPNVATSFGHLLCHVATLTRTSRHWLVYSLSRCDVDPHVATLACLLSVTSRRRPARRDVALF